MAKKTLSLSSSTLLDGMVHHLAYKFVQISFHVLLSKKAVEIDEIHDVFSAISAVMREIVNRNELLLKKPIKS